MLWIIVVIFSVVLGNSSFKKKHYYMSHTAIFVFGIAFCQFLLNVMK